MRSRLRLGFIDDLKPYIDSDGLIGSCPNPTPGTNGNPLVSAGVAACIDVTTRPLLYYGVNALSFATVSDGYIFWNKKARSKDQITHDDIIGIVASNNELITFRSDIYKYGIGHHWIMSNTGKIYWDAISKPWHIAFYKMAANRFTMLKPILFLWLALGLIFKGTASDRQLDWLMIKTIQGKSKLIDLGIKLWRMGLKRTWGDMTRVMTEYYGPFHPFTRYIKD